MSNLELFNAQTASKQQQKTQWNMVSDQVMGGLSQGHAELNESAIKLTGQVSLENNGGFLQIQYPIEKAHRPENYTGIFIKARSVHPQTFDLLLKSSQLWMPWQSFRAEVKLDENWQLIQMPFENFAPYRTQTRLNPRAITKFSILAGGKAMEIELEISEFGFYR